MHNDKDKPKKLIRMCKVEASDLSRIETLYKDCILNLTERGLYQWDERYPSTGTFTQSIEHHCQYLFEDDDCLVG